MKKLTLTGLALVSAACAFATDFPEGSGAIEISEAALPQMSHSVKAISKD